MDHPSKRRRLAPKMPDQPPAPAPAPAPAQPAAQHAPHYTSEQLLQLEQQRQHAQQQQYQQLPESAQVPERHDFESFARHLQDAAILIQHQTQRSPYSSVSVLLLRWEEDTSVEKELRELEGVLRNRYNYHTEKWAIPTVHNPSIKLGVQMASFLEHARPGHLLAIYYAGHGFVGADNHLYWACHKGEDAAKLKWNGVRCLFEDAQSDMMLLMDTCAPREAATAGNHGTKQAIAAYTPDRVPRQPPIRSFTSLITEAFVNLSAGPSFAIQRLYDEIVSLQQKDATQRSLANGLSRPPPLGYDSPPVLFTLTPGKGQSIKLPILSSRTRPRSDLQDGVQTEEREDQIIGLEDVAGLTFDEPRALVCTTFVGDASPDMSFFHNWLRDAGANSSKFAVEGMFLGPPTMLLISMPLSIWNVVQHDKVCCFLGHITSHNMTHLYQRLVRSSAKIPMASPKELEYGRALLEAREAAAGGAAVGRQEARHDVRHEPRHDVNRELRQEARQDPRQESRHEVRHESTGAGTNGSQPFHPTITPTRPRDGPRHGLPSSAPTSASTVRRTLPDPRPLIAQSVAKDEEVENSAEMQEAAEQLKALSNVGHASGESAATSTLAQSGASEGKHEDSGSSNGASDSGAEDTLHGSEMRTPSAKPKPRRSLSKLQPQHQNHQQHHQHPHSQLLKQETRCTMCTHAPFKDSSSLRKHIAAAHTRPFPCAFSFAGCTSTFGSKNEWKRHITSQHLCLQFYRCSACPLSAVEGKGNEFNRKDLFTQHLRRMHAPFAIKKATAKSDGKLQAEWETHVKEMQHTCLVTRRKPPQKSACPKPDCQSVFEGAGSWDEWTEHVGRHMEKGEGQHIGVDRLLAKWALDEHIIERKEDGEYRLCNQDGVGGTAGSGAGIVSGAVPEIKRLSPTANTSTLAPESSAVSDTRSETPPLKPPTEPVEPEDDGSIVVATTAPPADDDRMEVDD